MQKIASILFCISVLVSLWIAHDYMSNPIATLYEGFIFLFVAAFLFWPNKILFIYLILLVGLLWIAFSYFDHPLDSLCKGLLMFILLLFRLYTTNEKTVG